MSDLTADILGALAAAGRPACPDRAGRLARAIVAYGGLDRAAQALANDRSQTLLSDLLGYRAALAELANPRLRIARLRQEAEDLDARAEPLWAQGAQCAGRAAFRRLQGEADLADIFQRKTDASEQLAARLEAEALAKRVQAAQLEAALARREESLHLLGVIAA